MIQYTLDRSDFGRLANLFAAAGKQAPLAIVRAVNHTGDKARTQMRRALVGQTGLKAKTINKAVTSTRAFGGGAYVIKSHGGNIRLMFFKARETRGGVSAAPWNARRVFKGTFQKGGRFPNRVALPFGGAVLQRTGRSRYPLHAVKSGLFIPEEMIKGASEAAFYTTVQANLPDRLVHELLRVLG